MSLIKQNEAIHCKTQEEWDRVLDLLDTNGEVNNREKWSGYFTRYGKHSSIINDGVLGYSPTDFFTEQGYYITPASEFLARNGVEVKSIEEKIRDIVASNLLIEQSEGEDYSIEETVKKLTELFKTHNQ